MIEYCADIENSFSRLAFVPAVSKVTSRPGLPSSVALEPLSFLHSSFDKSDGQAGQLAKDLAMLLNLLSSRKRRKFTHASDHRTRKATQNEVNLPFLSLDITLVCLASLEVRAKLLSWPKGQLFSIDSITSDCC